VFAKLVYVPEPSHSGRTLVSVDRPGVGTPLPTGSRLFRSLAFHLMASVWRFVTESGEEEIV
jgi:hypothetical protein